VESTAIQADAWHHRTDAITSLAAANRHQCFADWGARVINRRTTWRRLWRRASLPSTGGGCCGRRWDELMDASPNRQVIDKIRKTAAGIPGVQGVEKVHGAQDGARYYVDMHLEVDPQMTVQQGHAISHDVKDKVKEKFPAVRDVLVHIEPAREAPR